VEKRKTGKSQKGDMSMDLFQYKKFYFNPANGQAIGIVCREETVSWGKVNIVEVATPGIGGMLMPQKENTQREGWVEITANAFKEFQIKYSGGARRAKYEASQQRTLKARVKTWLGKLRKGK